MQIDRRYLAGFSFLVIVAMLTVMSLVGNAQTTNATLTGTVFDSSGAVVPKANVTLTNESSGDVRRTVTNSDGYFTFAAIPPASYTIRVEMAGFAAWETTSVVLNASDKRNVAGIKLTPGAAKETITVEATAAQITPIDSGEKSNLINERILQNVAIVGQNAAEFVKIMPGMAMTGGVVNSSSYSASDERTGNGPVQNFAPNGLRVAAMDITSDGAHIIDPGCNCGQAMNTNADMTSEVKVLTSNFGADSSKGPVVINAIGKSGGDQYHGELYLYNRYSIFNANDWLNNNAGLTSSGTPVAPRPETSYWYPGAQIGGPVVFPWTKFNREHHKMFFFFATQAYRQNVDNGIYRASVPTQAMRNGDFSDGAYLSHLNGSAITGVPNNHGYVNGILPANLIDPNGLALMNTYPLPNVDPAQNGGANYINSQTRYSNMFQIRGRVDYNITDSTKLYVSYNRQNDSAEESLDTLWTGNAQSWASPTTPYPTPLIETSHSEVVTANLTKVISPTLTNEVVFSYTWLNLPNSFQDPTKVARGSLGLNYNMLFSHANQDKLIFPQLTGWGDGISNMLNTGFELNGTVYAKKTLPSVADNVYKVWGTHTSKFGFYWERAWNSQPGNGAVNGSAVFSNWGSNSSGNAYADMLIGQTTQYSELNYNVVPAFRYMATEFYGQDSWKVSHRLTMEYGMRFSHLGPWTDSTGYGFAVWYPNLYSAGQGGSVNGVTFPGIEWNSVNASTPLSGTPSRAFFYNPRVGFAWDVLGSGRTVLRGGYGMYRYHDEQNVQNGAYGIVRGSFSSPTLWSPTLASLQPLSSSTTFSVPSSVSALDPNDSEQPRVQSYSLTVAQRMPWNSVLEVAYVGNKADYLSNYNNNFSQINDLGVGALFNQAGSGYGWLPDCFPAGQTSDGGACSKNGADTGYNTANTTNARPLGKYYGTLKILNHQMYSNYNSMQVSWNKQAGRFTYMANYTFGKALGIRGENGGGGNIGDPTNLKNNYGTLPNNRTHIFNLAYVYQFPNLTSANRLVKGVLNDWQVSGIGQYQSGADLQAASGSNQNFNYTAYIPAGTTFMGKTITSAVQTSNQNVLGTPDVLLMPKVICDPRKNLGPHQYINGNCFQGFATPGQQGDYVFPTLTGPGFFNTDLSLFKNFTWGASENKKLQFRFSGYNFLNHANASFISGDPALNLNFNQQGQLVANGGKTFGVASYKVGHRIMQMAVKFTW
jgi:Carboxypeptidase regulatory-like domain